MLTGPRACVPAFLAAALLLTPVRSFSASTLFTQTYSVSTAPGGNAMTAVNAASVSVARAALRDTVSNTGNSVAYPLAGANLKTRSQFLVEESQLGYGGVIDSVGLKLNTASASAVTFANFRIKLVHTLHNHTNNSPSATFAVNYDGNTPVTVFGPATLTVPAHAAGDLLMLDVSNLFTYDNTGNLLVEFTWSNAAATTNIAVTSNLDTGSHRWNVTANSDTASTGTTGKDAIYFVFRFAADNVTLNPYDGSARSVIAAPGSTFSMAASSSGSGATQRWITSGVLGGNVAAGTFSRTFYHQVLPSVTLEGTSAANSVSTLSHVQFGVSIGSSGRFGSFSEWADRGSTLGFSPVTTGVGLSTADPCSFAVSSAFDATIHYSDRTAPAVTLQSPNGGESWFTGSQHDLNWTASDNVGVGSVDLDYSVDGGSTWIPIVAGQGNTGTCGWTLPGTPAAAAEVRVTARDVAGNVAFDTTDAPFEIRSTLTGVALASLEAEVAPGAVRLSWTLSGGVERIGGVTLSRREENSTVFLSLASRLAPSSRMSYVDGSAAPGAAYVYRVTVQLRDGGRETRETRVETGKAAFALAPARPNPCRGSATLGYSLSRAGSVRLEVFDVAGRRVRTLRAAHEEPGAHTVAWDGRDDQGRPAAAGLYVVRLASGEGIATRRAVLVR